MERARTGLRGRLRGERRRISAVTHEALRFLGLEHRRRRRTGPPGSRPDTMVIPPGAPVPRVEWIQFSEAQLRRSEPGDIQELAAALDPAAVDWIHVTGFGDEAVLREIGEIFGIHPLAMADIVNVPQRPKLDVYSDRYLIVLQMARVMGESIDLQQISLVFGPGWVITFEEHPGDVFEPVRARLQSETSQLRQSPADFLAYALIDAVVDGFFPVLDRLADTLEDVEEEALAAPEPRTLARVHAVRRLLLVLHRVQRQQRDALIAIARDERRLFRDETRPYLRDVQDHAIHVLDSIETYREMSVGVMDIYLSSVSNRTNDVMKTLTVMASLFIPLTFLVGVYGMNFDYMPELHWRWGYPLVWGLMLVAAFGLMLWFRRRGWWGTQHRR